MGTVAFQLKNLCPARISVPAVESRTAVNAAAIVTGEPWQQLVRSLMEQAHLRACMPTYETCVTDMLRANGFASCPPPDSLAELAAELAAADDPPRFAVRIRPMGYFAFLPSESRPGDYDLLGCVRRTWDPSGWRPDALWQYCPGTDHRTGIRREGFRLHRQYGDHMEFASKNVNPDDKNVGDCAVRALCTVLECSWHEAVDLLAEENGYTDPLINSTSNITAALIHIGLARQKALRRNGRLMTGKEFCDQMTYTLHGGERIFAFVGRSHCAAILPFREENGAVRYKIQDTWDSTDRYIGDYWVVSPKENDARRAAAERPARGVRFGALTAGQTVKHPQFGEGEILGEADGFVEIRFPAGVKRLSKAWLEKTAKK